MTGDASGASGASGTSAALDLESAWRLAGSDGDGRDQAVTINRDELTNAYPGITVGRHPKLADRAIDEPSLSRRHFRLSRSASQQAGR